MIDIKNIALNTGCNIQQIVGVNPPDYRYGFNSNAQLQAFADEYAALLYSKPIACMYVNVPEGYCIVPIEPTKEMMYAAHKHYESDEYNGVGSTFKAMLSAAPTPPIKSNNKVRETLQKCLTICSILTGQITGHNIDFTKFKAIKELIQNMQADKG